MFLSHFDVFCDLMNRPLEYVRLIQWAEKKNINLPRTARTQTYVPNLNRIHPEKYSWSIFVIICTGKLQWRTKCDFETALSVYIGA